MAGISDLLVLGIIAGGIYYAASTGMLNNILPQQNINQLPTEASLDDSMLEDIQDEINKSKKKKKDKDKDDEEFYDMPPMPQAPPGPPRDMYGNPLGYRQTGQWQNRNVLAPPPGAVSSLYPVDIPQTPPYVSPTVNTYSQYSPYNQFSQYQQYQTPQSGYMQTAPDDNIGFTDIDTTRYGCATCKSRCQSNPYGFSCATCRMGCKKISHYYKPPQTGWTITPAGGLGTSQYSFFANIWDTITGGATFAEMDDYSQKRRFDCHNKLKRRVRSKDNSFVQKEDYYYDRNDIQVANA